MSDFLDISEKTFLVAGVANRKSVAYLVGQTLASQGARVIYSVRSEERRAEMQKLLPDAAVTVCDVEHDDQVAALADFVSDHCDKLHGLVHSIALADYPDGMRPFHEVDRPSFLRSVDVSCFSLIAMSRALAEKFSRDASVVTISISTTRMASENYGYMGPVKAALDSTVVFLAKSFSQFSDVRFNAVGAGLLKTSASAGIPGYVDAYLYAEQATLRNRALQTDEVANVAAFLLSPRSSGINAQTVVVDGGMSANYFDREIVARATRVSDD